jgi:hypothetical protein
MVPDQCCSLLNHFNKETDVRVFVHKLLAAIGEIQCRFVLCTKSKDKD